MTNRCYICNSTNNSGIATEPEDYRENNRIFPDPQDPIKDICQECHDTSQYCLNEMEETEDEFDV